ncbi:hypothetical protein L915_21460 [Phytophthora nicotianae]|uniref:SWIM-type domain-containing protein n=1 Tax=Phytophthora nicotianae TaxID=4792 RepID=W2FKH0_PHYNI|nr:hypothetical protein L915_21460 [Phytophthora nicotianae]
MVQKLKEQRRGSTTVEARLESNLRDFCLRKGNTATIYVDDDKLVQVITFQPHQMRRFFEAFPEVLMIDATHNTNDARHKLFSFMIHDVFGHVRALHLSFTANTCALMENESAECLSDAIKSFKSFNATWDGVRVIIVDKDFGEISLLQAAFPAARILLCVFHVVKYLWTEMAKRVYGLLDREKFEDAVHMMLGAQTEGEYEIGRKYLYYIMEEKQILKDEEVPGPEHAFLQYFDSNWHHAEKCGAALGVLTSRIWETQQTIALKQHGSVAELEYAKKMTDVGYMRYGGADAELEKLAKEVSQHAYQLVEKQYRVANERKTHYNIIELQDQVFELSSAGDPDRKYHVDTRTYRCSCTFMRTELLPCRHVIYWRLLSNKSSIPLKHIHSRWSLTSPANISVDDEPISEENVSSSFRVSSSALKASRHKVLNGTSRFRTSHETATRIADIMSRNGTPIFKKMMEALQRFEQIAITGEAPVVSTYAERFDKFSELYPLSQLSGLDACDVGLSSNDSEIAPTIDATPSQVETRDGETRGQSHSDSVPSDQSHLDSVPSGQSHLDSVPSGQTKSPTLPQKRANSSGSSSSEETSFFVSKSTKSRGRPKIRKAQKQKEKRQRMVESRKEAKQLVQGTLTPVTTPKSVARVLNSSFSYESANEFLSSVTVKALGPRKQVLAKVVAPHECSSDIKFIFTDQFVAKCRRLLDEFKKSLPNSDQPIGIRVAKVGVFSEEQLGIMHDYYTTIQIFASVVATAEWIRATSPNRLAIPAGLREHHLVRFSNDHSCVFVMTNG